MAYAVHTRSCTYLLDDDGICRWTLAPTGVQVPGAERYLGAQFVACLDVREIGGLVGELRNGATALFARSENGRFVLLRTPVIEFVEHRAEDGDASAPEPEPLPPPVAPQPSLPAYTPYVAPPPAYASRPPAPPSRPTAMAPTYPPSPTAVLPTYPPRPPPAPPTQAPPPFVPLAPLAPPMHAPRSLPALAPPVYSAPTYRAPPPPEPRYTTPTLALAPPEPADPSTDTLPLAPMHTLPFVAMGMPPAPALVRPAYAQAHASEPDVELDPEEEYLSELDVEELVTFSEVTLTIPLYRAEAQTIAPLPRRGVIGPGRRLR